MKEGTANSSSKDRPDFPSGQPGEWKTSAGQGESKKVIGGARFLTGTRTFGSRTKVSRKVVQHQKANASRTPKKDERSTQGTGKGSARASI